MKIMKTLWFILGREPLLSAAEIISFLKKEKRILNTLFFNPPLLTADLEVDEKKLINNLGGTIKIGAQIAKNLSESELLSAMEEDLKEQTGKITFGISSYSKEANANDIENWGKQLKRNLKSTGRSVRYVFKRESDLSSVTVEKNDLTERGREFLVFKKANQYSLAKTIAVQPFENFSARDFGRPGRDSASGMLPPKLAMMLVNLTESSLDGTILDPFCGSGTVLSESFLLGYKNIIGTDLSSKAVADAQQNIDWTKTQNQQISSAVKIFSADAQSISQSIVPNSVDAIATEPYLGKPFKGAEEKAELLTIYKNAFSEFKKIMRPRGHIVFIIPRFLVKGQWVIISNELRSHAESLGFKVDPLLPNEISSSPFILYSRPQQYVGREIWRFIA